VSERLRTLLLVEDDPMVRGWIKLALKGSAFRLVGEATDPPDAVALVERRWPEMLLIDYRLGEQRGTELLRELRWSGVETPALLMSAIPEPGLNEAAFEAMAQGTFLKTGSIRELLAALGILAEGGTSFDPRHPLRPTGERGLSPREREILKLIATGATNRQIAVALAVTPETVKTLVNRIFGKLGVHSRAEAVAEGNERGLL
jgi:DNA-binding NarL/FixJ family response regulator